MSPETPPLTDFAFRCVCGDAPVLPETAKPEWAAFAGCAAELSLAWKQDEACARHPDFDYRLAEIPPVVGQDGWMRLDMPFAYTAAEPFWWLWQPAEATYLGYEGAPHLLTDIRLVRSRLLDLERIDPRHGIARASVLEIVTLANLKTMRCQGELAKADLWKAMPMHKSWTVRHGDLSLTTGNLEGDAGGSLLLWTHDGGVDLLIQTVWDAHADHVFAGRVQLR